MQPAARRLCDEWPRFRTGVVNAAKRSTNIHGHLGCDLEAAEGEDQGMYTYTFLAVVPINI